MTVARTKKTKRAPKKKATRPHAKKASRKKARDLVAVPAVPTRGAFPPWARPHPFDMVARSAITPWPRPPRQVHEHMIGIGPVVVAPRGRAIFKASAQFALKRWRLIIPSTIAGSFDVNSFAIDGKPMWPERTRHAATEFTEFGGRMPVADGECRKQFVLTVTNYTKRRQTFTAAIVSEVIA